MNICLCTSLVYTYTVQSFEFSWTTCEDIAGQNVLIILSILTFTYLQYTWRMERKTQTTRQRNTKLDVVDVWASTWRRKKESERASNGERTREGEERKKGRGLVICESTSNTSLLRRMQRKTAIEMMKSRERKRNEENQSSLPVVCLSYASFVKGVCMASHSVLCFGISSSK